MTDPPLNLLAGLPPPGTPDEEILTLLARPGLRIERIVSTGQASPPGFWYDQPQDEWVLVLAGAARLRLDGEPADRVLGPGDHLLIPAHRRHRVAWTSPDAPTVWLAVHLPPAPAATGPQDAPEA
ncbi:MAG: cupin domain-containing protein [Methylobacterium sp.]|uniref:cupin domain-containing protein n=1 Tax=Methylobacterium sp. TaxID=409 RepID=UPI002588C311|nr:cupin domain-containing protein [Methylobacterium sp.]MBY0298121.1 cupin domain-containing protein [Methylobacterium sp.]